MNENNYIEGKQLFKDIVNTHKGMYKKDDECNALNILFNIQKEQLQGKITDKKMQKEFDLFIELIEELLLCKSAISFYYGFTKGRDIK